MMSGLHVGSNFRRFGHSTLPPLAMVVLLALPLLFGGLFVWSYYNPLGNMNKLPVALVNSDTGTTRDDGTRIDAGEQVVEKLLDKRPLDFHLVSADEARRGISDGTYYLGLEIPSDFSAAAASIDSANPHQAKINITLNETNGFIPTMLGNQATTVISSTIADTMSQAVVNRLLVGFNTVGDGLNDAAGGAGQLNDGASRAANGTEQLDSGTRKLNDGAHDLHDGLVQLSDGADRLDQGIGTLQTGADALNSGIGAAAQGADALSAGMGQLQNGTEQLGSGASRIAGGVDSITALADQLGQAQQLYGDLTSALDNVVATLDHSPVPGADALATQAKNIQSQLTGGTVAAAMNPDTLNQIKALQDGAHELSRQLNDPTSEYKSGLDQAVAGAQSLADALKQLQEGAGTLVAGVATLKDGSSQLVVGTHAAADGSSQLAAGSHQLVVGVAALRDGLVQLDAGSGELALRLNDGAQQAPSWDGDRLAAATDAAAVPAAVNEVGDGLTFFGKGLSPFFLSLSLWVGGLAMFMVLSPFSRRAIDSGVNPFRALLASLLPAFIIGFGQATLLWIIQVFVIGVEPAHPGAMLTLLWFVSWVFLSMMSMINAVFGTAAGRLLTMALMSLQLVASNGLYPTEVQPTFVQWLHRIDPMRFSVDVLRYSLFGCKTGDPRLVTGLVVLTAVGLGSWVIA